MQQYSFRSLKIAATIMFAGTIQAFFLGLILIVHPRGPVRANRLMGVLLLSIGAEIFIPLQYLSNGWSEFPHLVLTFTVSTFLNGPLLLWYVRTMTEPAFRLQGYWWLHLLPAAINLALILPMLALSSAELTRMLISPQVSGAATYLIPTLKLLSMLCYFSISLVLLQRHRNRLVQSVADIEHRTIAWLMVLIIYALVIVSSLTIIWLLNDLLNISPDTIDYLFAVGLTTLVFITGVMSLRQPEVFSGDLASSIPPEDNQRSLNLSSAQIQNYRQILSDLEQRGDFYLDPEITIGSLSKQTGIPTHHLSYLLNAELGCNFFNYINSLRIEQVKRQLREQQGPQDTILNIALDAGFNNKTSFNKAFRQTTGLTPSQYRRKHQNT